MSTMVSPELLGRVAVVTGGAHGIGAAIVRHLAGAGTDVALVDVDATIPTGLPDSPARVQAWRCDVTDSAAVDAVAAEIESTLGSPAILVNNVGGSGGIPAADIEDVTDDLWERIVALNLDGMFRFARRLIPGMKARRDGRIVNITSSLMHGVFGGAATVGARLPYVTAKSGIVGFTKQLAKDLGPFGITVNAVAPGFTLPDEEARITRRFRALPPEQQRVLTANIPTGRPASGDDIAHAVLFLASPRSGHITGEVLTVAGGS